MRLIVIAIGRLKQGPKRELVSRYLERAIAAGRNLGLSGFDVLELPESRAAGIVCKTEYARALRAGGDETCALDAAGAATCWGHGFLGDSSGLKQFPPPKPGSVVDIVDIALAHERACALLESGGAKCWGRGPLGDGSPLTATSVVPVSVVGLP